MMNNDISILEQEFMPIDIRVSVSKNILDITYTSSSDRKRVSVPIDVIEVDGKLFGIETTTYSVGLIDLSSVEIDPETRPLVKYRQLKSGIFMPIDLLDEGTIKRLLELDKEYFVIKKKYEKECGKICTELSKFGDLYLKQYEIISEQAKTIVLELERKGFKFNMSTCGARLKVDIIDPRGHINSYLMDYGYQGGYSVLGETYYEYAKHTKTSIGTSKCEAEYNICDNASPIVIDNRVLFKCGNRLLVPMKRISPSDILKGHIYRVEYAPQSDIVLAFVPTHYIVSDSTQTKVLKDDEIILFGRERYRCDICGALISETPLYGTMKVDVLSVNGKLYVTDGGKPYEAHVHEVKSAKLSKFFIKLPSGMLVELGEANSDVLKRLIELEMLSDNEDEVLKSQVKLVLELGITPYMF